MLCTGCLKVNLIADLDIKTGDIVYDTIEDVNGVQESFYRYACDLTGTVDHK